MVLVRDVAARHGIHEVLQGGFFFLALVLSKVLILMKDISFLTTGFGIGGVILWSDSSLCLNILYR